MNILFTVIGVIILASVIIQFFAMMSQRKIKTYPYKVNVN
jgi:hypothetical protein